jgi:hypothetical protein
MWLGPWRVGSQGKLSNFWRRAVFHLRRAFSWNLRSIVVEPAEQALLSSEGTTEPALHRYLTWRRSVLLVLCVPVCLLALLDTLDNLADEDVEYNGLGMAWLALIILASYAMPLAAILALRVWSRLKKSSRRVAWGWTVAFLVPLLLLAVPFHWLIRLNVENAAAEPVVRRLTSVYVGLTFFGILLIVLPVILLSITFGVQRACLRLKTLLPESSVPGLFLAASAPVVPFFVLPFFVLLLQIASSPLLIGGMALLVVSPILYLVGAKKMARPYLESDDFRYLHRLQWITRSTFWVGIACLILYAFSKSIPIPNILLGAGNEGFRDMTLLGLSEATSLFRPWNWTILRWFVVEMLGRSLFTMVVVSDLLVRINAFLWIAQRQTAKSGKAESYGQLMEHLDRTL